MTARHQRDANLAVVGNGHASHCATDTAYLRYQGEVTLTVSETRLGGREAGGSPRVEVRDSCEY